MLVRSNADSEVGLSLYTDWQLKTKKRALASHASKNNRQEERAPCLTRGTRFKQTRERAPRHALLPIQDQRRVRACHAPYAYKGRVRVPSLQQRTHALATYTRSLVPRPPRPKWTCTCTHGFWCGAGTAWNHPISNSTD